MKVLVPQLCPSLCNPWIVALQDPPSMEFSRQEYYSGWPYPSPGHLTNPRIEPRSPVLQADSLPLGHQGISSLGELLIVNQRLLEVLFGNDTDVLTGYINTSLTDKWLTPERIQPGGNGTGVEQPLPLTQ